MTTLPIVLAWAVGAGLPAVVLALTIYNLFVWPRGRPGGQFEGDVSVLIPARNEAETIEEAVRAVFAGDHPVDEVVVYDDRSTDGTSEILERLQHEFSSLRVLEGRPLPEGWVGKPHACHRLAEAARGDYLVFVDADTRLTETGLGRLASLMERWSGTGLVSAVPRQKTEGFVERLVVPLLHLTYTSWLALPLVWRTEDPRFLAVNGQIMAMPRRALEDVGGFEAVRAEIVDDMALARVLKEAGWRVVFADGHRMATCRMYRSAKEVWDGFSKNLFEGIGTAAGTLVAAVLYLTVFVVPYVGAGALYAVGAGAYAGAAVVGVAANVVLRSILAIRFRQPAEGVVLHPLAVVALVAISINSFIWNLRGEIRWAGRTYASRGDR